jgi:serine/threonine protein kinase
LKQYAIKIYFRSKLRELNGRSQENPHQEIAAMQFIGNDHIHVMGQIECCGDNDNIYSVMDFSDGMELFDYVDQNGPLNEETAKRIFHQILLGTQRIHSMDIGHRDMSLENVMVSRSGVARIIDFGMSLRLPRREDGAVLNIRPQGACGKKNYVSPEVIANRTPFNPQLSDIWALGVKLFIMLTGLPVVDMAYDLDERYQMVKAGRLGSMLLHWNITLSAEAVDLMTRILRPVPADRLSLEEILAHPWMASAVAVSRATDGAGETAASPSATASATVAASASAVSPAAESEREGDSEAMKTDA